MYPIILRYKKRMAPTPLVYGGVIQILVVNFKINSDSFSWVTCTTAGHLASCLSLPGTTPHSHGSGPHPAA